MTLVLQCLLDPFGMLQQLFCTKKLLSLLEHQLGHIIALCQSKCGVTVKECTTSLGAAPLSRKSWNSSTQLLRTTSASWASSLYIDEILQIKHIKHRKANRPESMIRQVFIDSCFVFKNNHQISPMFCPKHGALTVLHALLHRSHATATGCTIGYSPTNRCPAQLKHQDKAWDTPQIYSNLQTIGHSMHSWLWYVDCQDKNGCWTKFGQPIDMANITSTVFEPSPGVQILPTHRPPAVGSAQWRRARPWHRNMLKKRKWGKCRWATIRRPQLLHLRAMLFAMAKMQGGESRMKPSGKCGRWTSVLVFSGLGLGENHRKMKGSGGPGDSRGGGKVKLEHLPISESHLVETKSHGSKTRTVEPTATSNNVMS